MSDFYPPVSFHFSVKFNGIRDVENDIRFQSVTGLDIQLETESIKEGGVNYFEHVVPSRTKYSSLTLKRGILRPTESGLTDWCIDTFEKLIFKPINLEVNLLNESHTPLMYWKVIHAWPKNWKLSELNAEKGDLLIETLELNYNRFEFKKGS